MFILDILISRCSDEKFSKLNIFVPVIIMLSIVLDIVNKSFCISYLIAEG